MPPEDETQKEAPKEKSSKGKLIIILAAVVVLLGGGGAFAYLKFFKAAPETAAAKAKDEPLVIQEMETFLVNLADPGGKRFLKVTMKAKLNSTKLQDEFKNRSFEMRDIILTLLSSKEAEELARPEDKQTLKKEILALLNRSLSKGEVQDIYFTEFLIQ